MSALRPSLTEVIRVMTRAHTADPVGDRDLAEVLRFTVDLHVATAANADRAGNYGRCRGCGQWWPCQPWRAAEYAGVEWLVNASNAVMRRSGLIGPAVGAAGRAPVAVEPAACYLCDGACASGG